MTGEDGAALSRVLKTAVLPITADQVASFTRADAIAKAKEADAESVLTYVKEGNMIKDADAVYLAMIIYFPEEIGNTYGGASYNRSDIELETDLALNLLATQATVENDSFGPYYDANATYKNEVKKFTFANASDADAFCPDCYNAGNTDGHASHTPYLNIKDGVAEIEKTGAWLSFSDLDWEKNSYIMEYDVDLSKLDNGAFVAFNAGENGGTWTDLQLGFKRTTEGITAYNTLFKTQLEAKKLGSIGDKVHVSYTYAPSGADLKMEMTISDDQKTYQVERTVTDFANSTKLCWCVYTAEDGADTYAAIDNMVFRYAARFQLSEAVEDGGYIKVPEDTMTFSKIIVNKDTTIDLNQNDLQLLPNKNLLINAGNVKIKNGTVTANHSFGYIDIRDVTGPINLEFENVNFECTESADSNGALTNNIIKAFIPDQKDIDISFKNCNFTNAAIDLSSAKISGDIVFENCSFNNITSSSDVTLNLQNVPAKSIQFKKCEFNVTNVYYPCNPVDLSRASGHIQLTECTFDVKQKELSNGVCTALNVSRLQEGASVTIKNCKFDVLSCANSVCTVINADYNDNKPVTIVENEAELTFSGNAYRTFVSKTFSQNVTMSDNALTGF